MLILTRPRLSVPCPLPIPPTADFPNLPGDYTTFNVQPWNVAPRRNSVVSEGWVSTDSATEGNFTIETDVTAPVSPTNVAYGLFPTAFPGGAEPFYMHRPFAVGEQGSELYIGRYMYITSNWTNNGNVETKDLWPGGDTAYSAQNYTSFLTANLDHYVTQQGSVSQQWAPNVDTAAARMVNFLGVWNLYEYILIASSANGVADGELHVWINDEKTHEYTNVAWHMAAEREWLGLLFAPTYGGGLHPVPADQAFITDHIVLASA